MGRLIFCAIILQDLFPGVDCPRPTYPELKAAVIECLRADNYTILDIQVDSISIIIIILIN